LHLNLRPLLDLRLGSVLALVVVAMSDRHHRGFSRQGQIKVNFQADLKARIQHLASFRINSCFRVQVGIRSSSSISNSNSS
jgi:hypothetical protein